MGSQLGNYQLQAQCSTRWMNIAKSRAKSMASLNEFGPMDTTGLLNQNENKTLSFNWKYTQGCFALIIKSTIFCIYSSLFFSFYVCQCQHIHTKKCKSTNKLILHVRAFINKSIANYIVHLIEYQQLCAHHYEGQNNSKRNMKNIKEVAKKGPNLITLKNIALSKHGGGEIIVMQDRTVLIGIVTWKSLTHLGFFGEERPF